MGWAATAAPCSRPEPSPAARRPQAQKRGDVSFGGGETDAINRFISAAKTPPVYMGWGSMISVSPEHMAALAVGALKRAG